MTPVKRRILQLSMALIFLLAGAVGLVALKASKPPRQTRTPEAPVPPVQIVTVTLADQPIIIRGEGTVRPLQETQLVPQVNGKVIYTAQTLVDGGLFEAGDELLRIDPVDFELAVTLAQARVQDAEAEYMLALQESEAALQEWRDLNPGREAPDLVARKPQLAAAKARRDAERADYQKALLQLARTNLKAPFSGVIAQEQVDIGQYVTPGQVLATLYGTAAAEIVVPLSNESLRWIEVPGFTSQTEPGSSATVHSRVAGVPQEWAAAVVRAEGQIDEKTRLVNVVVRVEKPYEKRPPLAVGLFVDVAIQGRVVADAALLPRAALRSGGKVWVVDAGNRLNSRPVRVAHLTTEGVIIAEGLTTGERVMVSQLKTVTEGMRVRPVAQDGEQQS
jgi:RND family efflux transporter MFP subunit